MARSAAKKRSFSDIFDKYKTYNPATEGYGNPDEWIHTFRARMGLDEARSYLHDDDPLTILGLSGKPTWGEIKRAYRAMALRYHPDHGGSDAAMQKINAAFTVLENRYGK